MEERVRYSIIRSLIPAAALLLAAAMFSSCKSDNTVSSLNDIVFPASNISYDRTVQPLFNIACAVNGCHDAQTMAGNLDLSNYSSARYNPHQVIIPRDTTLSHLVWRIDGKFGLPPMPPTRALTLNQRTGLKRWILEGATDTIK